jgi:hypothetical protein
VVDLDYRPDPWPSAEAYWENVRMLLRGADLAIRTEEEVIVGCANFMPRLDEVERFIAACDSSLIGG